MNLMENLNSVLWILFAALSAVEAVIRLGRLPFRKSPIMETLDSFWVAMAVALTLKSVWVQPFTIPSGSMEDTLLVGDYILVKKYSYGYSFLNKTPRFLEFSKPKRGDVVVFVYPEDHSLDFIKRCVGTPGDVLEYKDKTLYVNGQRQDEPYVKHIFPEIYKRDAVEFGSEPALYGSRDNFGPVTVEPGHYFMMGDNRDNSKDSRYWGQLDEKLIKGKAWFIYWHSVGWTDFLILAGLGTAAVSLLLWIFEWALGFFSSRFSAQAKANPPPQNSTDSKSNKADVPVPSTPAPADWKTYLWTIIFSLALAGVLLSTTNFYDFKDHCSQLKERIFTVIK